MFIIKKKCLNVKNDAIFCNDETVDFYSVVRFDNKLQRYKYKHLSNILNIYLNLLINSKQLLML
jgi:hypothetical protein